MPVTQDPARTTERQQAEAALGLLAAVVASYDDALLFCGASGPEEARTRERASRLLAALPEREREVWRLRFLRGYTAEEIGRALGLAPDDVRLLQWRALRRATAYQNMEAEDTPASARAE